MKRNHDNAVGISREEILNINSSAIIFDMHIDPLVQATLFGYEIEKEHSLDWKPEFWKNRWAWVLFREIDVFIQRCKRGLFRREYGANPYRLNKCNFFMFHQKRKDIAALPASKAVEDLTFGIHIEGGCFFVMERTQPGMLAPLAGELHPAPDQRRQPDPGAQLIQKLRWKGHGL